MITLDTCDAMSSKLNRPMLSFLQTILRIDSHVRSRASTSMCKYTNVQAHQNALAPASKLQFRFFECAEFCPDERRRNINKTTPMQKYSNATTEKKIVCKALIVLISQVDTSLKKNRSIIECISTVHDSAAARLCSSYSLR